MPPAGPEPTVALAQARSRWGEEVVVAGLFRPGPEPDARSALAKARSRRATKKRGALPARLLVAVDAEGWALVAAHVADGQGGHPEGDDLFAGPFEELDARTTGTLAMAVQLPEAPAPLVLEALWLDRDAATVVALLTGDALPDEDDDLTAILLEDPDELQVGDERGTDLVPVAPAPPPPSFEYDAEHLVGRLAPPPEPSPPAPPAADEPASPPADG